MKTMWSVVMIMSAGCAVDPGGDPGDGEGETVASEVQALGAGCTLLRPLMWDVGGNQCLEYANTPLPMADGDVYTASSGGGGFYGHGSVSIKCNNGSLEQLSISCRPGVEP